MIRILLSDIKQWQPVTITICSYNEIKTYHLLEAEMTKTWSNSYQYHTKIYWLICRYCRIFVKYLHFVRVASTAWISVCHRVL